MKKLWLMMLVGCAVSVFPACSDGDDETKPSNPITEYSVPPTAEIGGFYAVTGKGFDPAAQLFLRNASGVETQTTDLTVTATGVQCVIPSTLTPGVYTVVVKQQGSWDLGSVRLEAAQMPILSLSLPATIRLNQPLEIAGIGFTAQSRIFLEPVDAAGSRTELAVALSASGVSCTIPEGLAAGSYNVILKQNNIDWTLGENVPAAVYKRLKGIRTVDDNKFEPDRIDPSIWAELGVTTPEEIAELKAVFEMMNGVSETVYEFVYTADGQLAKSRRTSPMTGETEDWYTFAYAGETVSGTNAQFMEDADMMRSFKWTLSDGRVERAEIAYEKRNSNFTWGYDAEGHCTGINGAASAYKSFNIDAGNFMGAEGSDDIFEYKNADWKNNLFGVDVAKVLTHMLIGFLEDDHLHAACLNLMGRNSTNLPSGIVLMDGNEATPLTYTFDKDGFATELKYQGAGMDPYYGICPYQSNSTVEFIYE